VNGPSPCLISPSVAKTYPSNTIETHREVKELATNPSTRPFVKLRRDLRTGFTN
jgi:hypothetical protein